MCLSRKLQCAMALKGHNLSAKSQYGSQVLSTLLKNKFSFPFKIDIASFLQEKMRQLFAFLCRMYNLIL